jgi:hypothetical protein
MPRQIPKRRIRNRKKQNAQWVPPMACGYFKTQRVRQLLDHNRYRHGKSKALEHRARNEGGQLTLPREGQNHKHHATDQHHGHHHLCIRPGIGGGIYARQRYSGSSRQRGRAGGRSDNGKAAAAEQRIQRQANDQRGKRMGHRQMGQASICHRFGQ